MVIDYHALASALYADQGNHDDKAGSRMGTACVHDIETALKLVAEHGNDLPNHVDLAKRFWWRAPQTRG